MNILKEKGFTIVELMAVLSMSAIGTITFLDIKQDDILKNNKETVSNQISNVLESFDSRISEKGYSASLWNKTQWNTKEDVLTNLFKEQLKIDDNSFNDFIMSAKINTDNADFIDEFVLSISYDHEDFEKNKTFLPSLSYKLQSMDLKSNAGDFWFDFHHKSTDAILSRIECGIQKDDCIFKASWTRNTGSEYVNVNGENSVIGKHISFIEGYGTSPLKCIRWSERTEAGVKTWQKATMEECGIGIYKKLNEPLIVEAVANSLIADAILLDKYCDIYDFNGTNVVKTGEKSPCGLFNDGTDIVQIIETTMAENTIFNRVYSRNSTIQNLSVETVLSEKIEVSNLKANGLATIQDLIAEQATLRDLKVVNDATFEGDVSMSLDKVSFSKSPKIKQLIVNNLKNPFSTNINGEARIKYVSELNNLTIGMNSSALSIEADGATISNGFSSFEKKLHVQRNMESDVKMSAPVGEFDNINGRIANIETKVKSMPPVDVSKLGRWKFLSGNSPLGAGPCPDNSPRPPPAPFDKCALKTKSDPSPDFPNRAYTKYWTGEMIYGQRKCRTATWVCK